MPWIHKKCSTIYRLTTEEDTSRFGEPRQSAGQLYSFSYLGVVAVRSTFMWRIR